MIGDLLAWHCDILDSETPRAAGAKLIHAFGAAFGERAEEQSALVGQLIGLDFSGSRTSPASPRTAGRSRRVPSTRSPSSSDLPRPLVCHRVLKAASAPRADGFLRRAHDALLDQVRPLADTDRATCLAHVKLHRAIVDAHASRAISAA